MKKRIIAAVLLVMIAAISMAAAQPRWQKIMTTDEYRYYFDTVTISYGRTVPQNARDDVDIDKNIIDFYAQKIYWEPQNTAATLAQIDSSVDWSNLSYSVSECKYDVRNRKICQGDISFFDENGMLIGTIPRNTWSSIAVGSDQEKVFNFIIQYAKDHNSDLKKRA